MKEIKKLAEGTNFTAVNVGELNSISTYSIPIEGSEDSIKGKIFLKDITNATGTEISLSTIPPKGESPFFHTHTKNEETYIILSGEGKYQVDDKCFDIVEGSIIRVAPNGKRSMINTSDNEMVYIVIQSKENSLEEYSLGDGNIVEVEAQW